MSTSGVRPIALVGLMGAGKSEVARQLGERLGASVADLDAMIEAQEGAPVAQLFERSGEAWFRRRESDLLAQLLLAGVQVLATGGGIVLDADRRARLREQCFVVWLEVSPEVALARIRANEAEPARTRPLLAGADPLLRLTQLLAERSDLYAEVAHVRVHTDGRSVADVADEILRARASSM